MGTETPPANVFTALGYSNRAGEQCYGGNRGGASFKKE